MKRIVLFFSIAMCSIMMYAAPWNGTKVEPANDGTTYTVSTAEELAWVAGQSQTNDFAGKVVVLTTDLDLGGKQGDQPPVWTPIGNEAKPFQGTLDGANHVLYNIYIMSSLFPKGAGLFAETGENAVIKNLAIAQGQIMTDASNNIGCFVGVHRGTISHCFNMAEIIAHNGNNIGGLVGANYGKIEYSYNTGIITDAKDFVGGLVGYNYASAVLNECYNVGYCKGASNVGALFGKNEAPAAQFTKVHFDQQMTRMFASGDEAKDVILDNTKFAVEKTKTFMSEDNPFNGLAEWETQRGEDYRYPRLKCFNDHEASLVSVNMILLDAEEQPMERADGVGTPMEGNNPRKEFFIFGSAVAEWFSPSEDVIKIEEADKAQVFRPCSNQPVILTVTEGVSTKQIYTEVKGYNNFDAGTIEGEAEACWNNEVKFSGKNRGKEPYGGKDDEQDVPELSYQYMIIRDTVITNGSEKTYLPIDTFYMNDKEYKDWSMPTDVPGEYSFRRFVHDAQCRKDWLLSPGKETSVGRLNFTVRAKFDPGELFEEPDYFYGDLPTSFTILSKKDASGGSEKYEYRWKMVIEKWNVATGAWEYSDQKETLVDAEMKPIVTASCTYTFDKPGRYTFTRRVTEDPCGGSGTVALNDHVVYVYETLNAGSIEAFERALCTPSCDDIIHQIDAVSGGNGRYTFRWTCNGQPIENSNDSILNLATFPMSNDNTYIFKRQVKDDTGKTDWLTSDGEVKVRVLKEYEAGAIRALNNLICSDGNELNLTVREERAAQGEPGTEFTYCWLLYRDRGGNPQFLDSIKQNSSRLDATITLSKYGLSAPVTIFVKRIVQNSQCKAEWKESENTATWRLGRDTKRTTQVKVCELPYVYTYTRTDGGTQRVTFNEEGQTIVIQDKTAEGCSLEVTLQCVLMSLPVVEVEPMVSVCESAGAIKIAYSILSGSPDHFDLTFSDEAKAVGLNDLIETPMPASNVIEVPLPEHVELGKYSLSIVFYAVEASSDECKRSAPVTMPFSIDIDGFVHRKGNDVAFVDNSGKHNEEGITFVPDSYKWYLNGELIEGENGQFYYEYNGLNGYYQVVMTGVDGKEYRSCVYEWRPETPVENINVNEQGKKVIRNGRLLLIVGDKIYNMFGQEEK